jgi:hypothetical protein
MINKLRFLSNLFVLNVISGTHRTYTFGTLQYDINSGTNSIAIINTTGPTTLETIAVEHNAILIM